jgi:hypothetical protein
MGSMMEISDATPTDAIVPKSESVHDGYSSSSVTTPEGDIGPITQDVVQVQKRKGGRKPVHIIYQTYLTWLKLMMFIRYMPPRRSANRETDKHRLHSGNGEQNISSSLKIPSSTMRILYKTYSKVIALPLTSV